MAIISVSLRFSVAATGNCTSIQYSPDSTYVGADSCYYIICDNGTPVKCDTGKFVVNSLYNAALLPVAGFTTNILMFGSCMTVNCINTSSNVGSAQWFFHPFNSGSQFSDSIYTNIDSVYYYGEYAFYKNVSICLTVNNVYGSSTHCDTVQLSCGDGINEISLSNISLYPNPTNNVITVDMSNNQDEATRNYAAIEIYNAIGEKVKLVNERNKKVVNLSVADLPEGMYLATLIDAKGARRTLGRFTVSK
jgi:PKD repeat protein